MNRIPGTVVVVALAGMVAAGASAQTPVVAGGPASNLHFDDFLSRVAQANLELAAQRANVSIAEAQIAVARIFPDPALSIGVASVDVSGTGSPTIAAIGLSQMIELGGKRGARIRAAEGAVIVAQAELDDFFRVLRGHASGVFIEAVGARLALEQKRRSLASLERLVAVNAERFRAGDVGEIAVVKTRVEAQQFRADLLQTEGELIAARLALLQEMGAAEPGRTPPDPISDLEIPARSFDLERLFAAAREGRSDVRARRLAVSTAGARVDLARANRWVDLTLNLGVLHASTPSGHYKEIADSPSFDALSATVGIPLPFSRVYRGELNGALATEQQAKLLVGGAELRAQIEIMQAVSRYRAAAERVKIYSSGTLADADKVLEGAMYNYQRGGASLLEVLDAQRTVNDVYLSYYDALRSHAKALVDVETAAGIWDLRL